MNLGDSAATAAGGSASPRHSQSREFAGEDQSRRASGRDDGGDPLPRSRARPHGGPRSMPEATAAGSAGP